MTYRDLWPGRWTGGGWQVAPFGVLLVILAVLVAPAIVSWARVAPVYVSVQHPEARIVPIITYGPWYSLDPETGACVGPHTVATQQMVGETPEEWIARHQTAVRAALAAYPAAPAGACP